jgi:hypothetical protein
VASLHARYTPRGLPPGWAVAGPTTPGAWSAPAPWTAPGSDTPTAGGSWTTPAAQAHAPEAAAYLGAAGTRAPDVSYYRARPRTRGIVRDSPDLAVEVLSPDEGPAAVQDKVAEDLAAGVPLVWVVDAAREAVTVHRPGQPAWVLGPADVLPGEEVLPGFRLPLAELWATVAAEYAADGAGAAD